MLEVLATVSILRRCQDSHSTEYGGVGTTEITYTHTRQRRDVKSLTTSFPHGTYLANLRQMDQTCTRQLQPKLAGGLDWEWSLKGSCVSWSLYHYAIVINQWRQRAFPMTSSNCTCCNAGVIESIVHRFFDCKPPAHAGLLCMVTSKYGTLHCRGSVHKYYALA